MSAELAVRQEFTSEQVDLIKRTVANSATNDELAIFLHQCQRTGLDPLAKQIHFVKRSGKMAIQTAIDGYRLIADRTGKYAGNDDPTFSDEDAKGFPGKASVTVWKMVGGVRCPFTATARWDEYFPGEQQGFMWKKMPHVMLGKCAEALALRKAFPQELSGVYTNEEMEQAGPGDVRPQVETERPAIPAKPPANGSNGINHTDEEVFLALRTLGQIEKKPTASLIMELFAAMKMEASSLDELNQRQLNRAYAAVEERIARHKAETAAEPTNIEALAK